MLNPVQLVSEILENISNPRTKEILVRRFGLQDGQRQTLEAIGRDHGITRERVRQIEENGLGVLRQPKIKAKFQPVFESVKSHLQEHGEIKRDKKLYNDLAYICYPVKEIERMKKENNLAGLGQCEAAFNLILNLGDDFEHLPENDNFYPLWATNKNAVKIAQRTVDALVKQFSAKKQVLKDQEIFAVAKAAAPEISDKAIWSYIDATKHIEQNHLGHFGLSHWPEISPRGVKDKAYIILKNETRPLHFSQVTELINNSLPSGRRAFIQTVHNELIKDKRFVLVGRGLYALSEWGYEPGTVSQIISDVLKKDGPLTKEEIIKKVLTKRLVKENTILINLQNRKLFERDGSGRYFLKSQTK